CDDVNPGVFHLVLSNWLGIRKQAIIFDRYANFEVWNFPLYEYITETRPIRRDEAKRVTGLPDNRPYPNPQAQRFVLAKTKITYADAAHDKEILGETLPGHDIYQYVLELDENGMIIGGEWAFESYDSHPDFLWVPLRTRYTGPDRAAANPYLDIKTILQLWADSRELDSPNDEPSTYDLFDIDTNWGQFSFFQVTMDRLPSGSNFIYLPGALKILLGQLFRVGSAHSALTIYRDGKKFARPYLQDGRVVSIPLPDDEPGISRYLFKWKLPFVRQEDKSQRFSIYTME
ncbi:MAG: hypothetical protein OXC40_01975, partial [Proteobacteria bacterium]|nr:hypothetical protein [Pseudomonadota bacterium]